MLEKDNNLLNVSFKEEKLDYHKPQLSKFGDIKIITLGGSKNNNNDHGQNNMT